MSLLKRYFYFIAAIVVLIVHSSVMGTFTDVSPSMADTLLTGDTFLVFKFWYGLRIPFTDRVINDGRDPSVDDIIVFRHPLIPEETHVKRIVAIPGQTFRIHEKKLFLNDIEVPLPPGGKNDDTEMLKAGPYGKGKRDFYPDTTVPDSTVFVLGDNRDFSLDSRIFGFIPQKNIKGKVIMIVLSTDPEVSWRNIKKKIRWNRMFKMVR